MIFDFDIPGDYQAFESRYILISKNKQLVIDSNDKIKIIGRDAFQKLLFYFVNIELNDFAMLTISEIITQELDQNISINQKSNSTFVWDRLYIVGGSSSFELNQTGSFSSAIINQVILLKSKELELLQITKQLGVQNSIIHKAKFILDKTSKFTLKAEGNIDFQSLSCSLNQTFKGKILDNDSVSQVDPTLNIESDTAIANHGFVVGDFENIEIQYLRSRGLDNSKIRLLLVDAFFEDELNQIDPVCVFDNWKKIIKNWNSKNE